MLEILCVCVIAPPGLGEVSKESLPCVLISIDLRLSRRVHFSPVTFHLRDEKKTLTSDLANQFIFNALRRAVARFSTHDLIDEL